jgi:hypothetical protein
MRVSKTFVILMRLPITKYIIRMKGEFLPSLGHGLSCGLSCLCIIWLQLVLIAFKAECICLRQVRTLGYKISNCLLIPNEFYCPSFFFKLKKDYF